VQVVVGVAVVINHNIKVKSLLLILSLNLSSCIEGNPTVGAIVALAAVGGLAAGGGGGSSSDTEEVDSVIVEPTYKGNLYTTNYSTKNNDLLTAGFGQDGLLGDIPAATDNINPSTNEIRRAAIISQYKNAIDMRYESGYGVLYGAAVSTSFSNPAYDGKILGKEFIAYANNDRNITMMVQIPQDFNTQQPCIIAAPATGLNNVYSGMATVGEWGLKNKCAVTYTNKGAGNGIHDLNRQAVNTINGSISYDNTLENNFTAQGINGMDINSYSSIYPFRMAQKHAHSQKNYESLWGKDVLDSIEFALHVLNIKDAYANQTTIKVESKNTIIIYCNY
jgi:hydroxybutyrate-dimer hydrolase